MHASPVGRLGKGENGGMNLTVHQLCAGLSARGVPSDVFVRRDDPHAPAEELIAPGSRLVRLDAGAPEPLPKSRLVAELPLFTRALLEHVASERRPYRLVHSHYWLSGWVARRAALQWAVPWVHSFHTLARMKAAAGMPDEPTRGEAEQVIARAAGRLVAMSPAEERALIELYGVDPDTVCVVPPGVDMEHYQPRPTGRTRARLGLLGRRVVVYAGRLERLKGADLFIDAVAELLRSPGTEDVVALVCGDDSGDGRRQSRHAGGERGRLEALVRERGLEGRVRFLGAVPPSRLAELYALAEVCVVPSHTESFGLVALEAQASGTPVVATAVGGLVEVVENGVTGFLLEGRDPAAFAGRIGELLGDTALRERMGAAARERAGRYTWDRSVERLLALYDCVEYPEAAGTLETCGCL
ncbi:MAG TPA: glycosyltransferase [Candidatus Dormibacteraeota bacterium]